MKTISYHLQHFKESLVLVTKLKLTDLDIPAAVKAEYTGAGMKPARMYEVLERTFLGFQRLDLFSRVNNLREGWISVGQEVLPAHPHLYLGRKAQMKFGRVDYNYSKLH